MTTRLVGLAGLVGLMVAFLPPIEAVQLEEPAPTLVGRLSVIWGDPEPRSGEPARHLFVLDDDDGQSIRLNIPEELLAMLGGVLRVNARRVEVVVEADHGEGEGGRLVRFLRLLDPGLPERDVTGSRPWVSIMCKFSDVSDEPQNLAYFQSMFDNTAPRLDHYWRELSYDTIDVVGSTAAGWFTLPYRQGHYVPTPGSGYDADLNALFDDCTRVADPYVDFSNGDTGGYDGINLMFNALLDCCAWGGSRHATLDGVSKSWRTTWEPPWGWGNVAIMCHEMGHGFGLPHSNNAAGGGPYDNPWDVMSDAWNYAGWDSTYGTVGKHTISFHKDILGWILPRNTLEVTSDGVHTITIDHLALASTANYRMARITVPGSGRFYTVEVRDLVAPYDRHLPGNAVIIHEVDGDRVEPAWLVDASDPDNGADEGAMWRVGECFSDPVDRVTVCVDSATPEGFEVTIARGVDVSLIFADDFESGGTSAWSLTVPAPQ